MRPAPRPWLVLCASLCLLSGLGGETVPSVSVPRFTHPGAGQTVYFVMTDRFANGSTANDTGGYAGGPDQTGFDPTKLTHYHGGDFAGLMAKLDYIRGLGATAVWVTPVFKNKPVQDGGAGYHGYWILDFLSIDPHLGTNAEFAEFVRQAHLRGLRVYMDIIVNHTADVIQYAGGEYAYRSKKDFPYRDAQGRAFDDHAFAYNGLGDPRSFPALAAERSFPYVPVVPAAEKNAKNPAWLNDVTLYHNRGNSTFRGEDAVYGDFSGLDDLFTEQPRVVRGFIEIFSEWLKAGVDGYRIDTARHVNSEFWQAFAPAIRARARELGRPDFIQFGEVYNEAGDPAVLSEFSTEVPLDATLDFGFFAAARNYVSRGGPASALAGFFARDDYYTDHDSNVYSTPTFLGNHDAGRFAYFVQRDNPGASPALLADLVKLGHGLMFLSRGQPVVYYGDEQGMIGRGGENLAAREDMFASKTPEFKTATLLGTQRTGADDKFDPQHPFYRFLSRLAELRAGGAALRTGAMIPRAATDAGLLAFSRIERGERVEYLVALNNSRTATVAGLVPTSQPAGATLVRVFDSRTPEDAGAERLTVASGGLVPVTLAPLQISVWRAAAVLPASSVPPRVALVSPAPGAVLAFAPEERDGLVFSSRQEIRAEVTGGDGFAEVTFALRRASRPGQYELLGTDDAAPYRIFWRPPPDLAPGEKLTFFATVNDLRGHWHMAELRDVTVAPSSVNFGTKGAKVPVITRAPAGIVRGVAGQPLTLAVAADGTGPLEYQWLRDGQLVPSATSATYTIARVGAAAAGRYQVMIHGLAGTVLSGETIVTVPLETVGRIETMPQLVSKFVPDRRVDVWLPPGYDRHPGERYPVIYMHDGQNLFDPSGGAFGGQAWEVDQAMCRLIAAGRTRGAIIVGIWNNGMSRFLEYMPRKAATGDRVALHVGDASIPVAGITSDAYLKYLVEELKPAVDRAYRTLPDAPHTFVMGSSMGGLISAYALAEYPAVFGGAGCVSTHLPAGDGAMVDYLAQHLPKPGAHKLYFDFGTETLDAGYEPYNRKLDAVLRAAGYTEGKDWITRKFPGAEHSEQSWRQRVEIPLEFLLGP